MKTFDDLMRAVLKILPNAQLEEDNYGQIIIYTDLAETSNGSLVSFDPEEDEEDEAELAAQYRESLLLNEE